jgi:hypothetical protein
VTIQLHPQRAPAGVDDGLAYADPPVAYAGSGFVVIASVDATHHGELAHVSISHRYRDPTWDEIRQVRDRFFPPNVDVMMVLPKVQDYVNLHPHCFHLYQTPSDWDIQ